MMRQSIKYWLFLVVMIETVVGSKQLLLNKIEQFSLLNEQTKQFYLTISGQIGKKKNLYIVVESPFNEPYQEVLMNISSNLNYSQKCYRLADDFMDSCLVVNEQLTQNRIFNITVQCMNQCEFKISAYLNQILNVPLGNEINLKAMNNFSQGKQLEIIVPNEINFTQIELIARIKNIQQVNQGLKMFVNVGNENQTIPSKSNWMFEGSSYLGIGQNLVLTNSILLSGNHIKIYLYIGEAMQITFSSVINLNNTYDITIGQQYQGSLSLDQKLYKLNLSYMEQKLTDEIISINIMLYSGTPSVMVSFNSNFTSIINQFFFQGSISYKITQDIRSQYQFNFIIYIKINSYWNCNYNLRTSINSNIYYKMNQQITDIISSKNQKINNLIYRDQIILHSDIKNQNNIHNYSLKIYMLKNKGLIGFRVCHSMQKNSLDCLITNKSQLQQHQSWKELQVKFQRYGQNYEMQFSYNIKKCGIPKIIQNNLVYHCYFQFIVTNYVMGDQIIFGITIYRRRYINRLKQGQIIKDFIRTNQYHYLTFKLPSIENIQSVDFYITVIQGNCIMLASTKDHYPIIQRALEINTNIKIDIQNTISFSKKQISLSYYIAIFGSQSSQYTLTVKVNRNSTEMTKIILKEAISSKFILGYNSSQIQFIINSHQNQKIIVQIQQIKGNISYTINEKQFQNSKQIVCKQSKTLFMNKCTFQSKKDTNYEIIVKGNKYKTQQFIIGYFGQEICIKYPLNYPQLINLEATQEKCLQFSISELKDIQIIASLSTLQQIQYNINMTVQIENEILLVPENRIILSINQLKVFCGNITLSTCKIQIYFTGVKSKFLQFNLIVEEVNAIRVLFDGIPEKVVSKPLSTSSGQHFYYSLSDLEDIKILLNPSTNNQYYLAAKIIPQKQFINSQNISVYPEFSKKNNIKSKGIYYRYLQQNQLEMMQITSKQIKNKCQNQQQCMLLLSIYGLNQQLQQITFEVQITQHQSKLLLGSQKIGYLKQNQIYQYKIKGQLSSQSLISIQQISHQGGINNNTLCFKSYYSYGNSMSPTQIKGNTQFIVKKSNVIFTISVKNIKKFCTYQISYYQINRPIISIIQSIPSTVKLRNNNTMYFLYFHKSDINFKIVSIVATGNANIYINQVNNNHTVEKLIAANLNTFVYKNQEGFGDLQIDNNTQFYCYQCNYLIAIQAKPSIVEDLIIIIGDRPVPLSTKGIIKDKVILNKQPTKKYIYYSITSFNVTINILYGVLRVVVIDPNQTTVYYKTLYSETIISLEHPATAEGQYIDYFNDDSKFIIVVQAISTSSYYISAQKLNIVMRLIEGLPIHTVLQVNKSNIFSYLNSGDKDQVTLIVQIINQTQKVQLNISAEVYNEGQKDSINILSKNHAQNSYNYQFQSKKGGYFIKLITQKSIEVNLVMVNAKLTHLTASSSKLFSKEGIFEIYNPKKSLMIEIFNCKGQIQIEASSSYSQIAFNKTNKKSNLPEITLEHSNVAGHYVIDAQATEGDYYLHTHNRNHKHQQLLYIIQYYTYSGDIIPYKKLQDTDYKIKSILKSSEIIFQLPIIRAKKISNPLSIITINYNIYLTIKKKDSFAKSQCNLEDIDIIFTSTSQKPYFADNDQQNIEFTINYDEIQKDLSNEQDSYYVGAMAQIKLQRKHQQKNYPKTLSINYEQIKLTKMHHRPTYRQTDNLRFVILWIVLPFVIASFIVIITCKFCLRNFYKGYFNTELIEEDVYGHDVTEEVIRSSLQKQIQMKLK